MVNGASEMYNRGYCRLWCSVILQAVADIETGRRERYYHYKDLKKAGLQETFESFCSTTKLDFTHGAFKWLMSDEDRRGSFVWICDQVDLDRRKIRDMALSVEGRKTLLKASLRADTEVENAEKEEPEEEGTAVDPVVGRELV